MVALLDISPNAHEPGKHETGSDWIVSRLVSAGVSVAKARKIAKAARRTPHPGATAAAMLVEHRRQAATQALRATVAADRDHGRPLDYVDRTGDDATWNVMLGEVPC